jgi:hypothetical protein
MKNYSVMLLLLLMLLLFALGCEENASVPLNSSMDTVTIMVHDTLRDTLRDTVIVIKTVNDSGVVTPDSPSNFNPDASIFVIGEYGFTAMSGGKI